MERNNRLVLRLSVLELVLALVVVFFPSVLDAGGVPAWLATGPAAALMRDDVGCDFVDHPMAPWLAFAAAALAVLGVAWLANRLGARKRVAGVAIGTAWVLAGATALGLVAAG